MFNILIAFSLLLWPLSNYSHIDGVGNELDQVLNDGWNIYYSCNSSEWVCGYHTVAGHSGLYGCRTYSYCENWLDGQTNFNGLGAICQGTL